MKKIALILLSAAVIAAVTIVSINHYNAIKPAPAPDASQAIDQATAAVKTARETNQALVSKYNTLHVECLKGADAYAALPPATAKTKPAPVCGSELAE